MMVIVKLCYRFILNYVCAGWQPRWFVLNDGVLSYYKSLEDVGQGCKGSINVASCEIQLHPTDLNRLDLSIPGEQVIQSLNKDELN